MFRRPFLVLALSVVFLGAILTAYVLGVGSKANDLNTLAQHNCAVINFQQQIDRQILIDGAKSAANFVTRSPIPTLAQRLRAASAAADRLPYLPACTLRYVPTIHGYVPAR